MAKAAFKRCLGVDIGTTSVKIAEVVADKSGAKVMSLLYAPIPAFPDAEAQELGTAKIIKDLLKNSGIRTREAVFTLPGQQVFTRRASLPDAPEDRLIRIIMYEARQQIPFPEEKTRIEYQIFRSPEKDDVDVLMAAARKDQIEQFMRLVNRTGLKPIGLGVSSLALFNFYAFELMPFEQGDKKKKKKKAGGGASFLAGLGKKKKKKSAKAEGEGGGPGAETEFIADEAEEEGEIVIEDVRGFLNIGESYTDLLIARKGKSMSVAFVRPIVIAGKDLTKIIQNSMGFEDVTTAIDLKKERTMVSSSTFSLEDVPDADEAASMAVTDLIESRLSKQVQLSLDYFIAQPDGVAVDQLTVSGGSAQMLGLPELLEDRLAIPTERFDRPENPALLINVDPPVQMNEFCISIGAALGGIEYSPVALNFLPESVKTSLVFPRVETAILAVLIGVMIFISMQLGGRYQAVHDSAAEKMIEQVQQFQGDLQKINEAETTRTDVQGAIEKFLEAVDVDRRTYLVEFYAELVKVLRSATPLAVIISVDISPYGELEIVGRSQNPRDPAELHKALQASPYISDIYLAETRNAGREKVFRFKGSIKGKTSRVSTPRPVASPVPGTTGNPAFGGRF